MYPPPSLNKVSKQKRAMCHAMRKTHTVSFKKVLARLTKLNNYLPPLPGLEEIKNMDKADLDKIMLHTVPNGWANQSYLQGYDFDGKTYKETYNMFEIMEITEQFYEGGTPLKKPTGQIPTVLVTKGTKREDNPPHHPTLRRAALESVR